MHITPANQPPKDRHCTLVAMVRHWKTVAEYYDKKKTLNAICLRSRSGASEREKKAKNKSRS